jgi:hypothetical protein
MRHVVEVSINGSRIARADCERSVARPRNAELYRHRDRPVQLRVAGIRGRFQKPLAAAVKPAPVRICADSPSPVSTGRQSGANLVVTTIRYCENALSFAPFIKYLTDRFVKFVSQFPGQHLTVIVHEPILDGVEYAVGQVEDKS